MGTGRSMSGCAACHVSTNTSLLIHRYISTNTSRAISLLIGKEPQERAREKDDEERREGAAEQLLPLTADTDRDSLSTHHCYFSHKSHVLLV